MPSIGTGKPNRHDLDLIRRTEPGALPWPSGKTHLVVGIPGCSLEEKTFCDEGGWFSPGWGTFGVCLLLSEGDRTYRPAPFTGKGSDPRPALGRCGKGRPALRVWAEAAKKVGWFFGADSDLVWAYDVPGAMCELQLSPLAEAPPKSQGWVALRMGFRLLSGRARSLRMRLLFAPIGPSGGPIREWELRGARDVLVNGRLAARLDRRPSGVAAESYSETGRWAHTPGPVLRMSARRVTDLSGLASASIEFEVRLSGSRSSEQVEILFATPPLERFDDVRLKPGSDEANARRQETWKLLSLGPRLGFPGSADLLGWSDFPDERVPRVFRASMANLLNASTEGEARIAAASYPNPWLRDGAVIANAFQKSGHRDFARRSIEAFLDRPWAGDAGPEADAPGQLLWLLHEEWVFCRDRAFVQAAWPHIGSLVETIYRMRRLESPMLVDGHPVAWPAKDGLIRGRMDSHFPEVYVNSWALSGLAAAIGMARALGREEAREWHHEWIAYERCFVQKCLPAAIEQDFPNPRDLCSLIWPCRATLASPAVRDAALRHFRKRKCKDGQFVPDPQWRYFDLAQAHNYLWLGLFDPVWATLEWYFDHQEAPAAWAEIGGSDVSGLWRDAWSFHDPKNVIPHGWVSAEMWLLLRDLIYYADGLQLVIGRGVPARWWRHPAGWGVSGGATTFGVARLRVGPLGRDRYVWDVHLDADEALSPDLVLELPPEARNIEPAHGLHKGRNFWGRPCLIAERPGSYEFRAVIRD